MDVAKSDSLAEPVPKPCVEARAARRGPRGLRCLWGAGLRRRRCPWGHVGNGPRTATFAGTVVYGKIEESKVEKTVDELFHVMPSSNPVFSRHGPLRPVAFASEEHEAAGLRRRGRIESGELVARHIMTKRAPPTKKPDTAKKP